MHTRICTVPSGEVPVDQTAWPLTVILPPPTAGLGLRATCNASEPAAGGSEAVIGGPVVLGAGLAPTKMQEVWPSSIVVNHIYGTEKR